jgi:hypothetical protein
MFSEIMFPKKDPERQALVWVHEQYGLFQRSEGGSVS